MIAAASAFMLKALGWYDELSAKIEINRHARETYDVLAFGGHVQPPPARTAPRMSMACAAATLRRANGLRTPPMILQYTSNKLTLTPDLLRQHEQ